MAQDLEAALIGTVGPDRLDQRVAQEVGRHDVEAVMRGLGVGEEFVAEVVEGDVADRRDDVDHPCAEVEAVGAPGEERRAM